MKIPFIFIIKPIDMYNYNLRQDFVILKKNKKYLTFLVSFYYNLSVIVMKFVYYCSFFVSICSIHTHHCTVLKNH